MNEQSLQLVITDKSLGSLTTNALQIKAKVEAALPDYNIANYADNIDLAKSDKAMLNKTKKALNDERIKIEHEFMKPFEEFKSIVTDTCKIIDACAAKINAVVKEADEIEREKKRGLIDELWAKKGFTLVPVAKVFVDKWLLKGTSEKDINFRMDEIILTIQSDLLTIEAIGEDVETLKSMYLESLNLNETIQYSRRIKENKAKLAAVAPTPEPIPVPPISPAIVPAVPSNPYCVVTVFTVTAMKGDIDAVAAFMDENGIDYERTDK